ncbi:MAG: hypothetical protein EZS28_045667, partial [Streblomastix strix]
MSVFPNKLQHRVLWEKRG